MLEPLQLIEKIKTGFSTVKNVEKTLEQCFITDYYGMGSLPKDEFDKIYQAAVNNRLYDKWTDIPSDLIEKYDSPFCNMSNEDFAFYLPAYMVYDIEFHLKHPQQN